MDGSEEERTFTTRGHEQLLSFVRAWKEVLRAPP